MWKKKYYIPGVYQLNQLVETPASKERTERQRFIITIVISVIGAIASIVAAVVSILTFLGTK